MTERATSHLNGFQECPPPHAERGHSCPPAPAPLEGADKNVRAPAVLQSGGWQIFECAEVDSTNLMAASLPAWSAVRADTQTRGRGRFQRNWVSDAGGLWLSAVVPVNDGLPESKLLPLIAGLAVVEVCGQLGVRGGRMRWPNDVLIGDRKLAGLLVDQFKPGLAVVGIGINVNNQPEACDPGLTRKTIRLADLVEQPPGLTELTTLVLRQLRSVLDEANGAGFGALLPRVNALWGESRRVTLELDHGKADGQFAGVDEMGRLRLVGGREQERLYEAHQVKLLREI